jgi:hypothetical protein
VDSDDGGETVEDAVKTLRIGSMVYEVEDVESLHDDGGRLNGRIIHDDCRIEITAGLNPQTHRVVLWHEVLHGILVQAGIREHDEAMIAVLAYGIVGALRDNPELCGKVGDRRSPLSVVGEED